MSARLQVILNVVITLVALLAGGMVVACVASLWIDGRLRPGALVSSGLFVLSMATLAAAYVIALVIGRRTRAATATAAGVAAMVVITLCASLDADKYSPPRLDASFGKVNRLSDQTLRVIAGLPETVEITGFLSTMSEDETLQMRRVRELLDEYEVAGRGTIVLRLVDVAANPQEAQRVAQELGIDFVTANSVTFTAGRGETRRRKDVRREEFFRRKRSADGMSSREVFHGEEAFTSALLAVSRPQEKQVFFLGGHGERDITSSEQKGYARFASRVRAAGFRVAERAVLLEESEAVPEDCAILIVAGPTGLIGDDALAKIDDYLDDGGKGLFLIEPLTEPTGLRPLLAKYSVTVGDDMVIEPRQSDGSRYNPAMIQYPSHPITKPLANTYTVLYGACSVSAGAAGASEYRATPLLHTTREGWAKVGVKDARALRTATFDKEKDRRGPVGLAVAVERRAGDALIGARVDTRLVVVGDAGLASGTALEQVPGNRAFLRNAMNWMRGEETLISIPSKDVAEAYMHIVAADRKRVGLLTVVALPMLALMVGGVVFAFRSARYS